MNRQANKASARSGRSIITLLSALFVGILLVLGVGVTYALQQRHIDSLNRQVTDLTKQLSVAKGQSGTPTAPTTPSTPDQSSYTSLKSVMVKVYAPQSGDQVTSPLAVVGEVPGNWSFEASFPIKLLDGKGSVVAQTSAQVLGDWMTNKLVPFSAKLTWSGTQTGSGILVLQKDNPSGMMANEDSVSIPVNY